MARCGAPRLGFRAEDSIGCSARERNLLASCGLRQPVKSFTRAVLVVAAATACCGAAVALLTPLAAGSPGPCPTSAKPTRAGLATGISLHVSRNPALAGQRITLWGHLLGLRRHAQACGVQVTLRQRLPGQQRFLVLTTALTGSPGGYRIVLPAGQVTTNREWQVTARGFRSPIVDQLVQAHVVLSSTATNTSPCSARRAR